MASIVPGVVAVERQKVLSRKRRLGEQDPREQRALAAREQCFVSTIQTADNASKRCVFPFQYKGTTYQRCTSDHSANEAQWCATSVAR